MCPNTFRKCAWRPNFSHFGWEMTKIFTVPKQCPVLKTMSMTVFGTDIITTALCKRDLKEGNYDVVICKNEHRTKKKEYKDLGPSKVGSSHWKIWQSFLIPSMLIYWNAIHVILLMHSKKGQGKFRSSVLAAASDDFQLQTLPFKKILPAPFK